ncbi:hypothetical protein TNCV_4991061 [Trichonephila clavipes]|nr:hypothetical protein TNCV_4991061 [Trichonephila clavipes]
MNVSHPQWSMVKLSNVDRSTAIKRFRSTGLNDNERILRSGSTQAAEHSTLYYATRSVCLAERIVRNKVPNAELSQRSQLRGSASEINSHRDPD